MSPSRHGWRRGEAPWELASQPKQVTSEDEWPEDAADVPAGEGVARPSAIQLGGVGAATPGASEPVPIWVWMDYKDTPPYIELNLRSMQYNAPSPFFELRRVTRDMLPTLIPDMPEEFDRLPYAAAVSDLIRTALIAHYGGFYMDTDFLVQKPLQPVYELLAEYDFVSYTTGGQDCNRFGSFSSNFIAGRKGNALSVRAWSKIKEALKQRCEDGTISNMSKLGVGRYQKEQYIMRIDSKMFLVLQRPSPIVLLAHCSSERVSRFRYVGAG